MTVRITCREALLDAAESVVSELGAVHLTLDAVADRAKVSKGGLLYHFPSKDALLRAMLRRLIDCFGADQRTALEGLPPGPATALRAFVEAGIREHSDTRSVAAALLAASAINPSLLEPVRTMHQETLQRLTEPSRHKPLVWVIMMAIDGLWLNDILHTSPLSSEQRDQFRAELLQLATLTDCPPAGTLSQPGHRD
ncbi:MAG: TetR/AcrR family transcriptional regulator [Limisphaerales bacterium]